MDIFKIIKEKISIVTVAQEYVTLKKAGLYLKGTCPFHHEKTASFTVSPHKEIFYCFGCHAGGDVVTFITLAEHCNPLEAAHHLAERFNIALPEETTQTTQTRDRHLPDSFAGCGGAGVCRDREGLCCR